MSLVGQLAGRGATCAAEAMCHARCITQTPVRWAGLGATPTQNPHSAPTRARTTWEALRSEHRDHHLGLLELCPADGAAGCRTRELSVRRKLNAMPAVFEGRSVLLVDDSIVRGTTMSQIVDMVRQAGATKVRGLFCAGCVVV